MPDYSKTVIYQIRCKDESIKEKYIGHTTSCISDRRRRHKTRCNNEQDVNYNLRVYQFIRNNGGWDNWEMVELGRYDCIDKRDAEQKEDEYFDLMEPHLRLNNNTPYMTEEETKQYDRDYNRREAVRQKKKEYDALPSTKERKHDQYEERCEIIKERTNKKYHEGGEKERRIQDRIDNPEKWKAIDKINNAKRKPLTEEKKIERNRQARETYAKRKAKKIDEVNIEV
jgi:hypothetical protein